MSPLENISLVKSVHTKLNMGPECRIFHDLASEDINEVISSFFVVRCANSQVFNVIKTKIHGGLKI